MRIKNSKARLKKAVTTVGREASPHHVSKVRSSKSIGKPAQIMRYDLQAHHDALIETQAALEVSHARYSELYDAAPVGYITLSRSGLIEEINLTGAHLLGFARRQLLGHPLMVFITSHDRKKLLKYLARARKHARRDSVQLELERKDSTQPIFVELLTIPSTDKNHSQKFQCALIDITARCQAEGALRISEEKFRTMANHAPVGIFLCDKNGGNIFVNEGWCAMTGFSAETAYGNGWLNAVHPDDRERIATGWTNAVRDGTSSSAEFRFVRPDGAVVWVQGKAVPLKDEDGKFSGHIGTAADITQRKLSEEALRESEGRFEAIIDNSTAVIYLKDLDGRYILINSQHEKLFGCSKRQIIGKTDFDFFPPAIARKIRENDLRVITAGEPVEIEEIVPHPDGMHIYISIKFPLRDANGKIYGIAGISTDITERKRSEEASRRLAAIVESSGDAILGTEVDGTIAAWNKSAERLFGYTESEVLGEPITILVPSERHNDEPMIIDCVRRGERVGQYETVRRRKDGTCVEVSLTASPIEDADGKIIGVSKILRDITERKRHEGQQLALYELVATVNRAQALPEVYEAALDTILRCQNTDRAAILLYDADGVMRFKAWRGLSKNYCRAVEGHSPWEKDEPSPQPVFINDVAAMKLDAHLRDIITDEGIHALAFIPVTYEKRLLGKFMIYFNAPHSFTLEEIRPAQTIASQIAFAIERKRAEDELKRARDEAQQANHSKDNFLAALSHELRTPLNPVLLLASDAARNFELSPRVRTDFDTIQKNVELEARLIDDLLDISRITCGKFAMEMDVVDVHATLRAAIDKIQNDVAQKKIRLSLHLSAPNCTVRGDAVRLQQVFWNVLKNAVKFTPHHGTILVDTRTDKNELVIAISDSGIGMTPAETGTVFDVFCQGEQAMSHQFGGLGLGLAISQSIVVAHFGRIHAESAGPGKGSTFTVALPLISVAEKMNAHVPEKNSPSQTSAKVQPLCILLVEDHEPTRTSLTQLLLRRRHKVVTAASIGEARALAQTLNFDLLISDIGLPDGNGADLMRELGARQNFKGIALTGYGTEQDVAKSKSAGFIAHLTKPVRIESLDTTLAEIF